MIDHKYKVRRYLAEYSNETEFEVAQYEFADFDLREFQAEFNVEEVKDPMFDCFEVLPRNKDFVERYLSDSPKWNFSKYAYFVEAEAA